MRFARGFEFGAQVFDFSAHRGNFLAGHICLPVLRRFFGLPLPLEPPVSLVVPLAPFAQAIGIGGAKFAIVGGGHDHFSWIALDSMRSTVSRAVRSARKLAPAVTRCSSSPRAIGSSSTASSTRSSIILSRN